MAPDQLIRFLSKCQYDAANDCWNWTGSYQSRGGYGRVKLNKKSEAAHRVSYRTFNGLIPTGFEIDHICNNPRCVNPDHIEAVSKIEHERRTRQRRGEAAKRPPNYHIDPTKLATHCKNGHEYNEENSYKHAHGHRVCRICRRANEKRKYRKRHGH